MLALLNPAEVVLPGPADLMCLIAMLRVPADVVRPDSAGDLRLNPVDEVMLSSADGIRLSSADDVRLNLADDVADWVSVALRLSAEILVRRRSAVLSAQLISAELRLAN